MSWIAGPAHAAEPGPISAHIEWHGSVCGGAAEFAARISERTERVRFVPAGEQLRLAVVIERQGSALRANVSFLVRGKAPVLRKIESPDCDDALDALALVVAIAVDQRWRELAAAAPPAARRPAAAAKRSARPRAASPASLPEPGPLLDPGEASVTLAPSTLAVPLPHRAPAPVATAPPSTAARSAPPPTPAAAAAPWTWAAGVGARWVEGVAPEPLLGGELWLRASWERGSVLSPDFGVSVAHDRANGFERPEGSVDFALSAASAELCPLRFGTARVRLQPCLASSFGWLRASGSHTFRAHAESSPWWTLGGGAQVMANIGSLALRATGSAAHPFERNGYRFHTVECPVGDCDEPTFHHTAPVVWSLGAGAGLSF